MDEEIINKNEETIVKSDEHGTYTETTKINEDGSFMKTSTYVYNDPGTVYTNTYSTSTGIGASANFFKGKRTGWSFATDDPKIVCTFLAIFGLVFCAIGIIIAIGVNLLFGICWILFTAWGIVSEIIKVIKKNKK